MTKPNRKPPISRHPLFPGIVALWFAALFGIGSFALPQTLLESLVLASHVDQMIHAATPPLGAKAQLLLALLLGVIGALVGWVLAKRMAGRNPRPAPQVLKVADVDLGEPLPRSAGQSAEPAVVQDDDNGPALDRGETAPQADVDEPQAPEQPEQLTVETPAPTAAQRIAGAALDSLSHVELIERLAIGLQRRQEWLEAASAEASGPLDAIVRLPRLRERHGVRIAPPLVAPKPVPQETEKALRDALATLERMSGNG